VIFRFCASGRSEFSTSSKVIASPLTVATIRDRSASVDGGLISLTSKLTLLAGYRAQSKDVHEVVQYETLWPSLQRRAGFKQVFWDW
jgi:hypothetical protein